jgi:hypothetical protein
VQRTFDLQRGRVLLAFGFCNSRCHRYGLVQARDHRPRRYLSCCRGGTKFYGMS